MNKLPEIRLNAEKMCWLCLVEPEANLCLNEHGDRFPVTRARRKSPLLDSPHCLIIEPIANWLDNLDLANSATLIYL